jgi:hypothetical protein
LALHVQAASVSARNLIRLISMIAVATSAYANKAAVELGGVACQTPPPMHCPETGCPADVIAQTGAAVEPNTGRNFFLDCPCDLKAGEKVTFILSLHGAGSIGNWHRHYFPLIDCKDKYRLVVATPTSSIVPNSNPPSHVWNADADDKYLENIVNLVYAQAKGKNIKIKAFWLVGDSLGGATSSRLVRTDFFKDKVDGFLSLSGGRVGGSPGRGDFGRGPAAAAGRGAGRGPAPPPALPGNDFSFIYETGQHEMDAKGLPETSAWAEEHALRQPNLRARPDLLHQRLETVCRDQGQAVLRKYLLREQPNVLLYYLAASLRHQRQDLLWQECL